MERRRLLRRLAGVGLLLGLCLGQPTSNACYGSLPHLQTSPLPQPTVLPPPVAGAPEKLPAPPADGKAADGKACDGKDEAKAPDYWAKVPPVQPLPRAAWFAMPPTGEGYYSIADHVHGEWLKAPPKYPYPRISFIQQSFFDVDWRYLDNPKNTEHDCFDCLKRIRIGDDCMLFTTGGEYRYRYDFEENSRLLNTGPLRGKDNSYDLHRVRLYGDLMITDRFRVYAEFISATSPNYLLVPAGIDINKADLLNAFVDLALFDVDNSPVWLRVGRQELLYGSQRLISPLDWANTRRTFQGVKAFWQSEKWAIDAFCVQPIPVAPNPIGFRNQFLFDSGDPNRVFAGLWATYKPNKNQAIDAYYLFLDDTNPTGFQVATSPTTKADRVLKGATTVNTIGSRWCGDNDGWLWDFEGMLQFGGFYNQQLFAGAFTAGGGHYWKDCWGTPTVWLYYDYASGTDTPNVNGNNNTFNQLFAFGHYYFGFLDVVARRNIHDVAAVFTLWPEKWFFTQLQVHNFFLASARDALYNAGGLPIRQDATGRSGRTVGTEFDLLVNFHINKHSDVLIGYSYLAAGAFIRNTATSQSAQDNPQTVYVQYSYRW